MPFTVDGIEFSVAGLAEYFATAVAVGLSIGILMVVLTLAYARVGR